MNPKNLDIQYEEYPLEAVRSEQGGGWSIQGTEGWWFSVPADSPVEPKVGMLARFYGKGIGYPVRGLLLDGQTVFYRTVQEYEAYHDEQTYGKDAAAVLARWDSGKSIWSVAMGGLGPGYEQAIQITAMEILRHMLAAEYDAVKWADESAWRADRDATDKAVSPVVEPLGLSGAQWGAALGIAARLYRDGPISALKNAPDDRRIQVSKGWPRLEPATV